MNNAHFIRCVGHFIGRNGNPGLPRKTVKPLDEMGKGSYVKELLYPFRAPSQLPCA